DFTHPMSSSVYFLTHSYSVKWELVSPRFEISATNGSGRFKTLPEPRLFLYFNPPIAMDDFNGRFTSSCFSVFSSFFNFLFYFIRRIINFASTYEAVHAIYFNDVSFLKGPFYFKDSSRSQASSIVQNGLSGSLVNI